MGHDVVHVVWSAATGPIATYWVSARADQHACTMLGVDVTACELRASGPISHTIYIVWSPVVGPILAFFGAGPALAYAIDAGGMRVAECTVRAQVPPEIMDDVYIAELDDFDDDHETPVDDDIPPLPPPPDKRRA